LGEQPAASQKRQKSIDARLPMITQPPTRAEQLPDIVRVDRSPGFAPRIQPSAQPRDIPQQGINRPRGIILSQ
jgi:hypothetical protein